MIKKTIIATVIIVLVGAVGVGIYDAYQGNSTLAMPNVMAAGSPQASQPAGQAGQMQGQHAPGMAAGQTQGQMGQQQGQGQGAGNSSGQPIQHDWQTLTGAVIEQQPQGLLVDTAEQGELLLNLGRPGFADQQNVTFSPGDTVSIDGFIGDEGFFVAGVINNETTDAILMLRDPNGRPLWAGPGRQQQGAQGQGNGQGGNQGQGGGHGKGQAQGGGQGQNQNW
jgi:hypothetical protein